MTLDLEELRDGIMGLTPEFGSFCLQACTVCLESSNHLNGVRANLSGSKDDILTLNWTSAVDSLVKRNWTDNDEATEYGATAMAILLSKYLSKYECIERSSKGLGFDYWLGKEDTLGIFQRKARLEISGILKETPANTVKGRIKSKESQIKKSSFLNINAHICIMEFSTPKCVYSIVK